MEMRFRIRSNVFGKSANRPAKVIPISLNFPSVEEAALISEVDESGRLVPSRRVFHLSFTTTGPVIEGFQDCALGEFVKAQIETLSKNGQLTPGCEIKGLEEFLDDGDPEQVDRVRDLISICEFRRNEFTPEGALRFLKDSGFLDDCIVVGVKYGKSWRRSRCITTFKGRDADAAAILGHLAEYFEKEEGNGKIHGAD